MGWLRAPFNALCFALRERLAFSRGQPTRKNESKDQLFNHLSGAVREQAEAWELRLRERHALGALHLDSTVLDYRESLILLDALERLGVGLEHDTGEIRALDVGPGAWNSVGGLAAFLRGHADREEPRKLSLLGLEVDGHGIYPDFRSRADHARARAEAAGEGIRYQLGDVRSAQLTEHDVVTLFYPFLTEQALLAWGLPRSLLDPEAVMEAAVRALRAGGTLIVFNQTREEQLIVQELLANLPVRVAKVAPLPCEFAPYREKTLDRQGLVAVKTADR